MIWCAHAWTDRAGHAGTQVYSTELVTTLGSASKRLLDGLAAHMARPKPHDRGYAPDPMLAPRVIFALLQSPLNGADRELLAGLILKFHFAG